MKTALVVDSSRLSRAVVKELLVEQGFTTVHDLGDPGEALKALAAHKPDVVTLDHVAPGTACLDLMLKVRAVHAGAKILVLAENAAGVETQLSSGGADAVVFKPATSESFAAAVQKLKSAPAAGAPAAGGAPRVLIVDDSKIMRMMVKELVEANGLKVIGEAADVAEGIKAYDALKPDLVTLDMVMPGGSGMDVLKSIMARNPKAKVVMVTSVSQQKVTEDLLANGAAAILSKPLTKDGLGAVLRKILPAGVVAAETPKPKPAGEDAGLAALKDVLESGGGRCAVALTGMCGEAWKPTNLIMHDHAVLRKELAGVPAGGPQPIAIRMVVSRELPMTGLFLASPDSAAKMANKLAPGLPFGGDTVKVVAAEWANIMITNVLNAFSEALGESIMCSPPEQLDMPVAKVLEECMKGRPGVYDNPYVSQNMLVCQSLEAECEVWFVMSPECVRRLLAVAKTPAK